MEQALQWWNDQRSEQLTLEAIQIRDRLLQESFAVRRSLELAQLKSDWLYQWIERFEIFHNSLKELSDRLSPPYLEEGLPWAMEYLIEQWKITKPNYEFKWQFIPQWQDDRSQRNRIILTTLDELFKIETAKDLQKGLIFIDLKQNQRDNQLKITINYSNSDAITLSDRHPELEYLQQSFRVLTSGTWTTQSYQLAIVHYLKWSTQSE